MRVKILRQLRGATLHYNEGTETDLDDKIARDLIAVGAAQEIAPKQKQTKIDDPDDSKDNGDDDSSEREVAVRTAPRTTRAARRKR